MSDESATTRNSKQSGGKEQAATPGDPVPSEWSPVEPTDKGMGLARLTLDRGVKTTAIGQLYGLDFEIEGKGFSVRVFFDKYNRRLKVEDYEATDYRALVNRLAWLAQENRFDKIFLKARREDWQRFLSFGYMLEGILKYFFRGEDAFVMSRFSTVERMTSALLLKENEIIESLMKGSSTYQPPPLPEGYTMVVAGDDLRRSHRRRRPCRGPGGSLRYRRTATAEGLDNGRQFQLARGRLRHLGPGGG